MDLNFGIITFGTQCVIMICVQTIILLYHCVMCSVMYYNMLYASVVTVQYVVRMNTGQLVQAEKKHHVQIEQPILGENTHLTHLK